MKPLKRPTSSPVRLFAIGEKRQRSILSKLPGDEVVEGTLKYQEKFATCSNFYERSRLLH